MRTTSTGEGLLLGNPGAVVWPRLRIKDSGGTWQDWSNLADVGGAFVSAEWGDSLDSRYPDARIEVKYRRYLDNASPLITGSRWSGLLDIGREVEIAVALAPDGVTPSGASYRVCFHGRVQSWDLTDEGTAVLDCRDYIGALLADGWIEADTAYGGVSNPLDTTIEDILQDWAPSVSLWVPGTTPTFNINAYNQQPMAILDALRELALLIGADIRPRWRESSSAFELALTEPDRNASVPDHSFDEWVAVDRAAVSMDDIRNVIQVNYPGGTNDSGQREWSTVWRADGYSTGSAPWRSGETVTANSSIDRYGRRWMEVSNGTSSGIDNASEAGDLADAILADLATPDLDFDVQLPGLFWPVELNDYYGFEADGERFNIPILLAVMAFRHRIGEGVANTTLTCSGKPKAGRKIWLDRESRPGTTPTLATNTPAAIGISVASSPLAASLTLDWPTHGTWDAVEVHRSVVDGFTPSDTTLVGAARSTTFKDPGLDPAVAYYYKTRVLDADGNTGAASDQVTVTPDELPSSHIDAEARRGATVSLSAGQAVNSASYTRVDFNTITAGEELDIGPPVLAGWNNTDHRFQIRGARTYRMNVTIRLSGDGSATGITARLRETTTNTTLVESAAVGNSGTEGDAIHLTGTFELLTDSRVEVQVAGTGGTPSFTVDTTSIAAFWPELHT
jgi:hypothetical protein